MKADFQSLQLKDIDNRLISSSEIKKNKASVFIFLSPDCPLSQKYSLAIKNIGKEYSGKRIGIYIVFPGALYTDDEIDQFFSEYDLLFTSIKDDDKNLAQYLGATVTPEAFLVDSSGAVIYQGAIDNWFVDTGKKREVITEYYLEEAMQAFLSDQPVRISKTKAVGCIIE